MSTSAENSFMAACSLALLAALGYGSIGAFVHAATADGTPLPTILAWRFAIATLVLAPLVMYRWRRVSRHGFGTALLLGGVGFASQSWLYFNAMTQLGAGPAATLLYLYPAFVFLLNWFFNRRRPARFEIGLLLLSFIGCALTAYGTTNAIGLSVTGLACGIGTAVVYSLYLMISHRIAEKTDPLLFVFGVTAGAAISFGIAAVLWSRPLMPSPGALRAIGGLSLFSTVLPMGAIFLALRRLDPGTTALVSTSEMVFANLVGIFVLGEPTLPTQVVGSIMILLVPVLASRKKAAFSSAFPA